MNKNTAAHGHLIEDLRKVALTGMLVGIPRAVRHKLIDAGLIQRGRYDKSPPWMLTSLGLGMVARDFTGTRAYKAWFDAASLHWETGHTLTGVNDYANDRENFTPTLLDAIEAAAAAHEAMRVLAAEAEARMVEALRAHLLKENT
jgi:hypothetical protein